MLVSLSLESTYSCNCHNIPFLSYAYCFLFILETRRIEELLGKKCFRSPKVCMAYFSASSKWDSLSGTL
jgi:hypothetical protein